MIRRLCKNEVTGYRTKDTESDWQTVYQKTANDDMYVVCMYVYNILCIYIYIVNMCRHNACSEPELSKESL